MTCTLEVSKKRDPRLLTSKSHDLPTKLHFKTGAWTANKVFQKWQTNNPLMLLHRHPSRHLFTLLLLIHCLWVELNVTRDTALLLYVSFSSTMCSVTSLHCISAHLASQYWGLTCTKSMPKFNNMKPILPCLPRVHMIKISTSEQPQVMVFKHDSTFILFYLFIFWI